MRLTLQGNGVTASYNMVVAPRRKLDRKKSATAAENKYIGFATNMPWVDVIVYTGRWGVEPGYANVEAMRAKTRSRKVGGGGGRLFCFFVLVTCVQHLGGRKGVHAGDGGVPGAPPTDRDPAGLQGDPSRDNRGYRARAAARGIAGLISVRIRRGRGHIAHRTGGNARPDGARAACAPRRGWGRARPSRQRNATCRVAPVPLIVNAAALRGGRLAVTHRQESQTLMRKPSVWDLACPSPKVYGSLLGLAAYRANNKR